MGARADDRLRGGLLAGLAVAALAAGGWWWRHAAPATGPVPAAVSSAPATSAPPLSVGQVLIDAEDGHIIQGQVRFTVADGDIDIDARLSALF